MRRLYSKPPQVIQIAVVAFAHHYVAALAGVKQAAGLEVFQISLKHRSHRQRIGQKDGALQLAELRDLHQADRFAVAVDHVHSGGPRPHLPGRNDNRDAGPYRTGSDREAALAAGQRDMADGNAGHVHDGVGGAGQEPSDANPQLFQAFSHRPPPFSRGCWPTAYGVGRAAPSATGGGLPCAPDFGDNIG